MADQPKSAPVREEEEAKGEQAPAKRSGKWRAGLRRFATRRTLFAAAALGVLAVCMGAYAAAARLGLIEEAPAPQAAETILFYDLPEMVVNLSATERRAEYLKIKIALEVSDPQVLKALEPVMPRVLDLFQVYLRQLRASDLDGSAGIFRLKEELLRRVNLELHPAQVDRVLFKEIIIQ